MYGNTGHQATKIPPAFFDSGPALTWHEGSQRRKKAHDMGVPPLCMTVTSRKAGLGRVGLVVEDVTILQILVLYRDSDYIYTFLRFCPFPTVPVASSSMRLSRHLFRLLADDPCRPHPHD